MCRREDHEEADLDYPRQTPIPIKWAEPELNRRHMDFQSIALPAELSALMALNHWEIQRLAAYYRLIANLQLQRPTGLAWQ